MKAALVLFLAYIAAGICCVWRDLAERDVGGIKPYAARYRRTGNPLILLASSVIWPFNIFVNAYFQRRVTADEVIPIAFFSAAAVLFWIISN